MDGAWASAGPNGSHAFAINTVDQPSRTVIGPSGRRYPSPDRRLDSGTTPPRLSSLANGLVLCAQHDDRFISPMMMPKQGGP